MGAYLFVLKKDIDAKAPPMSTQSLLILSPAPNAAYQMAASSGMDLRYYDCFDLLQQQVAAPMIACKQIKLPPNLFKPRHEGPPQPSEERDETRYSELSGINPEHDGAPEGIPIDITMR